MFGNVCLSISRPLPTSFCILRLIYLHTFFSLYKENLWKSTGVQQAYQRRNEFQLADSAEYFLKNVTKYTADNFVPSDQDVLRTRIQTTGVVKVIYYQHLK